MLSELWAALDGDAARVDELTVTRPGRFLPARFDVDGLAVGAVGCFLLAAAELAEARGTRRPRPALDAGHVAAAFTSERHARRGSAPPTSTFAPLSRFARTRDGWIRLHANYAHHHAALLRALGTNEATALDAIAERDARELEDAVVAAGGAAAAVRTAAEWDAHPQGRAAAALPLVERRPAPPVTRRGREHDHTASRLRVVDLTRVIAGPVATRALAALGADVLRIDPPHRPEDPRTLLDTGAGKRRVGLDLRRAEHAAHLHDLLATADVLVHGYRPGALDAFGLGEDALAERHPHLVVATLGAWGAGGPWAQRRGFDSLVQAACGIADAQAADGAPGALPAQALDHGTGYLLAAAVLRATAARARGEAPWNARLALAATARRLMRRPARADEPAHVQDPEPFRVAFRDDTDGPATWLIAPPGALDGEPLRWRHAGRPGAPRWE
jgi:crotonobetainyl-CoA:carnitine CoA-transferase CaiB-like acyl-CoA transferase